MRWYPLDNRQNKTLTYVYKIVYGLYTNKIPIQDPNNQRSNALFQEHLEKMAKEILEKTKKGKDLAKLQMNIFKNFNRENSKQMYDCYININHYNTFHLDLVLEYFDDIFSASLFKNNTQSWNTLDLMNVFIMYNNVLKTMYSSKSLSSEPSVPLINKISFAQFNMVVENHISFLFDPRFTAPFYNNLIDDIKYLVLDVLRKDIENNGSLSKDLMHPNREKYTSFLQRLLHKTIFQIKLTRDYVEDLSAHCLKHDIKLSHDKSVNLEETLLKDMPRFEQYPNPETMHEKTLEFIKTALPILNEDAIFFHQSQQKKRQVPLLEEKEGFMIGSQSIDLGNPYMAMSAVEEGIFKRVAPK